MSGGAEIRRVQNEGTTYRTRTLSVRYCASSCPHPRVGLIVPRFGRSAVARNQLKRRIREALRIDFLPVAPSLDVVIRASRSAYELDFHHVREEIARMSRFFSAP